MIADPAILDAVLDRLESFGTGTIDSCFADTRHEAVLRSDLEVFVSRFRYPLIVFSKQTSDPCSLLVRSQWDRPS